MTNKIHGPGSMIQAGAVAEARFPAERQHAVPHHRMSKSLTANSDMPKSAVPPYSALFRLLPGGGGPIIFWRAQPFPVRGRVLANLANFDHEWRLIIMSLARNGEIGSKNGIVRPHSPALARISPHLPALRNGAEARRSERDICVPRAGGGRLA